MNPNCNIGWHFYRNYFTQIDLSDQESLKSDNIEKKFQLKNREIVNTKFDITSDYNFKVEDFNIIKLKTTYPGFLSGIGYKHEVSAKGELKLGFYFDYTTGLPAIPGSSVKGVLKSSFPQWDNPKETDIDAKKLKTRWIKSLIENKHLDDIPFNDQLKSEINQLEIAVFDGIKDASQKKPQDKYFSIYERDIFYDAFITKSGKDDKIFGTDAITPHIKQDLSYQKSMLKNPVPLPFLKILPNVEFLLQFDLKNSGGLTSEAKNKLFEQIILAIGIGAKTNVGYGQFDKVRSTGYTVGLSPKVELQREPVDFTGKINERVELEAKVVEKGKVKLTISGKEVIIKMTGNCPAIGTLVKVKINQFNKKKEILSVGYLGDVRN